MNNFLLREKLCGAIVSNDLNCIKLLVQNGLTLDDIRYDYSYPLCLASIYGHYDIVEFLIGQGITLDDIKSQNIQSLRWASIYEHFDIVELLVYQGLTEEEVNEVLKHKEKARLYALSLFGGKATKAIKNT